MLATDADGQPVARYASSIPRADLHGDIEAMSLWAGQSVGLVHDVRPAAEIVASIAAEARQVIDGL